MKNLLRILVVLAAVVCLNAEAARAGEPQRGELRAKNLASSTVTIVDRVYNVTAATVITDQANKRISLKDIAVGTDPNVGNFLFAEFVAAGDDLERLKVMDLPQ